MQADIKDNEKGKMSKIEIDGPGTKRIFWTNERSFRNVIDSTGVAEQFVAQVLQLWVALSVPYNKVQVAQHQCPECRREIISPLKLVRPLLPRVSELATKREILHRSPRSPSYPLIKVLFH